jgi:4-azaleucine resistance transporter AzlC
LDHCYWISGCTLGAILGATLPISFEGVDFVLTALFMTMFVEQWLSSKNHLPALVGLASTAVCLLVFGSEYFLIPSMILIAGILILVRDKARRTPYA